MLTKFNSLSTLATELGLPVQSLFPFLSESIRKVHENGEFRALFVYHFN